MITLRPHSINDIPTSHCPDARASGVWFVPRLFRSAVACSRAVPKAETRERRSSKRGSLLLNVVPPLSQDTEDGSSAGNHTRSADTSPGGQCLAFVSAETPRMPVIRTMYAPLPVLFSSISGRTWRGLCYSPVRI